MVQRAGAIHDLHGNAPPPQEQHGCGAPLVLMDRWGIPVQQPLPQQVGRFQAAAASTDAGGGHGRGWVPSSSWTPPPPVPSSPPFVMGSPTGPLYVYGPVPHEGVVQDSMGTEHVVVHKFTEYRTCGNRNLLCLLTQQGRQHVLFCDRLVGGSWYFEGRDDLQVRFHFAGDVYREKQQCYNRMAGTDSWYMPGNPTSVLVKHRSSG